MSTKQQPATLLPSYETLMAQVQQCGAGAGCCAQAARIETLEAQLEAVGAVPDGWRLVPVQPEIQAVLHMLDVPVLAYISSHSEKLGKTTADFDTFESAIPLVSQHAHRAACEKVISAMQAQLEAVGAGGVGALEIAEAALADIGDADREPGDDVAWCEARAAEALPEVRAVLITAAAPPAAQVQTMGWVAPGWQAVPVEPTKEMVIEAYEAQGEATSSTCKEIYRAMLAAAPKPAAQAGWCDGCSPDNCGGCATPTAPAQAALVDAPHSTACLYHYALSRLRLKDNTGLRVLFWDAHNSLSWDSKTDWYVTPDADKADCEQCNAAIAAQKGDKT